MMIVNRALVCIVIGAALVGCVTDREPVAASLPDLDRVFFDDHVQPILVERCTGTGCHSTASRPFRVYAPALLRKPGANPHTPLDDDERQAAYDSARSMVDAARPEQSPLLTKALDDLPGGVQHDGERIFFGYGDPEYEVLRAWAERETEVWLRALEAHR